MGVNRRVFGIALLLSLCVLVVGTLRRFACLFSHTPSSAVCGIWKLNDTDGHYLIVEPSGDGFLCSSVEKAKALKGRRLTVSQCSEDEIRIAVYSIDSSKNSESRIQKNGNSIEIQNHYLFGFFATEWQRVKDD